MTTHKRNRFTLATLSLEGFLFSFRPSLRI